MRITDNLQVKYKHVFYCGYVTVENKRSDKINQKKWRNESIGHDGLVYHCC
jgi:hypothetical protein